MDLKVDLGGNAWGPMRVWKRDFTGPGLAMSRSLGDAEAHSIGVTSIPDVVEIEVKKADRAVILASDGIWEVLGMEKVLKIVSGHYKEGNAEKAAEALTKVAALEWKKKGGEVDDITVIVMFFTNY